jgi:hypothetical protein
MQKEFPRVSSKLIANVQTALVIVDNVFATCSLYEFVSLVAWYRLRRTLSVS